MHVDNAAEVGTAETRFDAVNDGAHALPGSSTAPSKACVCRFARQRHRERMPARQRQPRRHFQQVGFDARRIDDARLRQRQRAGLVEDDRVGFGQPLDGVAAVENDAAAEQRAGSHHLDRRNRERERTRAGDDQHGDRGHQRVMHDAPAISQPAERQRRGRVHDRRVEPRGAVGKPHGARFALAALSSSRSISSIRRRRPRLSPAGSARRKIQAAGIDRVRRARSRRQAVSPVTRLSSISEVPLKDRAVGRHALAGRTSSRSPGFSAGGRHADQLLAA